MASSQAVAAAAWGRALCVSLCVLWLQGLQHERRAVSVMGSSAVVVRVGVLNSLDFQLWLDRLIMTSLWQIYLIQMHFKNNCQLINLILWNVASCCRGFCQMIPAYFPVNPLSIVLLHLQNIQRLQILPLHARLTNIQTFKQS